MRLVLMLLLAALVPVSGLAGAWPRPKGQSFVALSFSGIADLAEMQTGVIDVAATLSLYAEHGVTPRLTLGLDATSSRDGQGRILGFARLPILQSDGEMRFALKAGLGMQAGDLSGPIVALGADVGRGMTTPLGQGWLSLETWVEYRAADQRALLKSDLTAGSALTERIDVMIQLQGSVTQTGKAHLNLAHSLIYEVHEGISVEMGMQAALAGDRTIGVKLGTWLEF